MPAFLIRLVSLAILLIVASLPATAETDRRTEAYLEFRQAFAAGDYQSALPLAEEVTRLIEQTDPLSQDLPTAYNNLGVVQAKTGDQAAAERSFSRALELLEATQGIASRKMISPLLGLGAVYTAQGQHARAADALQRALAISRRADGLFNLGQLDILDALVRSYEAIGALDGVENELRYAVQIVQQKYGYDDPRCLPAMSRLAEWYERMARYVPARALWIQSAQIAAREDGGRNEATINGLLGVARTFRLQYVRDPESLQEPLVVDPLTSRPDVFANRVNVGTIRLDRAGEGAARQALEILDATPDPPKTLVVRALMELGDWYITAHDPVSAIPYYQRAWPLIPATLTPGEQNPLSAPRPLHYRPPPAAQRTLANPDARIFARKLEFNLSVAATGEVTKVTPITTDAPSGELTQVGRALDRAWFSPRFEDGQPVATEGFLFEERWFERASDPPPPPPEDKAKAG